MTIRCLFTSNSSTRVLWALSFAIAAGCTPGRTPSGHVDRRAKARQIVEKGIEAHGGLERWNSFQRLTVRYSEQWSWPFTWFRTTPWPANNVRGTLALWLHQARAEMVFDDRPDWTWRWTGRRIEGSGAGPKPRLKWTPEFVLPRTHYLTLLPFKFLDRGARLWYVGRSGNQEEVLVDFEPGTGATPGDRYWVLFDSDTSRMTRVVLTVTAYGRFAVGALSYEDYRETQGLLFPSRIRAVLNGPGWPLHLGEYRDWKLE